MREKMPSIIVVAVIALGVLWALSVLLEWFK